MVSSTLNPETARATATGNLVLRVRGSSRDGQIVRLASPKCTIGSGEQCTLRLRARSVGRTHCLILRGPNGTMARRWAPDTRLNGAPFTDALLTAGDRLSVGGIDLEILATGEPPHRPKVETTARMRDRDADLDTQRRQLDDDRRELDCQRQRLQAEQQSFDARQAQWQADRQSFHAQQAQWQAERAAAEQDLRPDSEQPVAQAAEVTARAAELDGRETELNKRVAELSSRSADLDARIEALDRRVVELQAAETRLVEERTALENDRRQWEGQRTAREAELDGRTRDLDVRASELGSHTTVWQSRAAELESRSADLAARVEELDRRAAAQQAAEARLGEERTALENDRRQWESQRTEREAELEGRARDLDARSAEPAAEVKPSDEEVEFETPKEGAPVDLAAVFRKIGAKPVLPEEEEEEPRPAKFPMRGKLGVEESSPARPAVETSLAKPKDEEDEGSIDDYMAQLLQRMRSPGGQTTASASRPAASPPRAPMASDALASSETESFASPAAELPPGRRKPAQMSPMTVAPEKHGGLAAMRELANMSAQTALHKHARGQTKKSARGKLLVAAVGALVGGLLLVLWLHWEAGPLAFVAAMAGFTVGSVWGVQWAFLTGHLIVNKGRVKWAVKPVKKGEEPPEEEGTSAAVADEPLAGVAEAASLSPSDDATP
jgi:hypothetical protein